MQTTSDGFDKCWTITLGNEGGYAVDNGGPTRWGVTEAVARKWGYMGSMKELPEPTAREIARANYWTPFGCDFYPLSIAFQVFDTAYNGGHPIQWLQDIMQTKTTGSELGAVLSTANCWEVVARFNSRRLQYLASLKQPAYADGRMNRIAVNMEKGGLLT